MKKRKFDEIWVGDRIKYKIPAGLRINWESRKVEREYKIVSGRVVIVAGSHVVCNGGGRFGTPHVVDKNNFVSE